MTRIWIYACFFFSGFAGLVYEVVWSRQLSFFLGTTGYAHTAVIAAYMIGLATGSVWIGRRVDRSAYPLRLYAGLEVLIGLYSALTPWLIPGAQRLYILLCGGPEGIVGPGSHGLRFSLALLVLLPPTFLMGGTLPAMIRGLTARLPQLAASTGRLYGVNTMGATAGVFCAGYFLLPILGLRGTIFLGVALNFIVAALVYRLGDRMTENVQAKGSAVASLPQAPAVALSTLSRGASYGLLGGFAVSGFAALVYQVAWIRAYILVVGGSVYAFTITLTTYLLGIGLGSLLYARLAKRLEKGTVYFSLGVAAGLEIAIGFTALAGLMLMGKLPLLFIMGYKSGLADYFGAFQAFIFFLCSLVIFPPTLMLGILFPLVIGIWSREREHMGRDIGVVYAANTCGTIAGVLVGGLLLMPALGVHKGIMMASGLHVAVGLLFAFLSRSPHRWRRWVAPAAAGFFVVACFVVAPWDRALMTVGPFANARRYLQYEKGGKNLRDYSSEGKMLYYKEGLDGTVAVRESASSQRLLVINGKTDASDQMDMPTQVLAGQLPMLLKPDAEKVLVVGVGSGVTIGTIGLYDQVKQLDALEISPQVVEAASRYFGHVNHEILTRGDARLNLVTADARNWLMASDQTYDMLISEPSNPWISGVSNLFTRDFLALAKTRLKPGGIMVQWVHTYSFSPENLKVLLNTFSSLFAELQIWSPMSGDLMLIGSDQPVQLDYARVAECMQDSRVRSDLQKAKVENLRHLLQRFIGYGETLKVHFDEAPLNTDNFPLIEYRAPKDLYRSLTFEESNTLMDWLDQECIPLPIQGYLTLEKGWASLPYHRMRFRFEGEDPQARWEVSRQKIQQPGNGRPAVGVLSTVVATWPEQQKHYRLEVLTHSADAEVKQLEGILVKELGGRMVRSGSVNLYDGMQGAWAQAEGPEEKGRSELHLTWTSLGPAGDVHRFLAVCNQPRLGDQDFGDALIDLAGRFRMLSP